MRVAITGSTGLIGAHMLARLLGVHEVVRLGRRPDSDVLVDLSVPETLSRLDLDGFDALVHCAGVIDEDLRGDATAAFTQATVGAKFLVARAISSGVRMAVYVSTSHVYGPPTGTQDESSPPDPTTDYAIADYASERFFSRAAGELAVLILRPNAVFGVPPSLDTFRRWSLIPFSFPREAVYRGEIILKSSGEQHRNFVSADDLADDVATFLASARSPGLRVVNPLGADSLTVYAFARRCADVAEALTGIPCPVRRPASAPREPGWDFAYSTRMPAAHSRRGIGNFLLGFTQLLVEESRNGRRYGT